MVYIGNSKHILNGLVLILLCCIPIPIQYLATAQIHFPNEAAPIPNFGRCITPNRERALCITLERCKYLYSLLFSTPLLEEYKLYLSRSQCGYQNGQVLICCSEKHLELEQSPQTQTESAPSTIVPKNPSYSELLPTPGQCGGALLNRIIGGNITEIDEFPWMALIEFTKSLGYKGYHCGGSLINQRYVITASHCVNGRSIPSDWKLSGVRLGEWDTTTNPDCQVDSRNHMDCAPPHLDVPVERAIPHPLYAPNSRSQVHDIALLRLAQDVTYTDFIRPICLPLNENLRTSTFENIILDVAGWGKTENETASSLKLKAAVSGVPLEECRATYKSQNIDLESTQMCAGGKAGVDSCRGDSGGPIVSLDTGSKVRAYYFLAGIVSFGPTPCGLAGWPGVYTRVGEYVDWIQSTLEP